MKKVIKFLEAIWNKGFFHVLMANVLIAVVAFGSQLFVAKILTDIELGYIKIFQSYTQILSLIAGMGFSTSALILCSGAHDMKQKMRHFSVALYAVIPISISVLLLFLVFNKFNVWTKIPEVRFLFDKYSFIVVLTAIIAVYTAFIQSSKIFKKYSNLVIVTKFVSIGFIILFTYLRGLDGFFEGMSIGLIFSLIINVVFVRKEFHFYIKKRINNIFFEVKEQFKIGIHGVGTNFFGLVASNIDIILLSFFMSKELTTIGQYGFASIIIVGLNMIQGTVVQVTVPYLAKYKEDYTATVSLLKKYNYILFIGTIGLLLLLYLMMPIMIEFVYGNKYDEGVHYLLLLLFVWFFKCLNAINASYFLSSNKSHLSNLVNFLNMILSLIIVTVSLKNFSIKIMIMGLIVVNLLITIYSYFIVKKSVKKDSHKIN